MTRVGIYMGLSGDDTPNAEKLINAWYNYLSDYELEPFGSADLPESCPCSYVLIYSPPPVGPYSKLLLGTYTCLRYIQQRNPDVLVQLIKFNTHAIPVSVAGYLTHTPTITRLSGAVYESYKGYEGYKFLFSYILNSKLNSIIPTKISSKIISFGEHGTRQLVDRGVDPDDIVILPPAGVEERFHQVNNKQQYRENIGVDFEGQLALYVGRLSELKGMPFLQRVIRRSLPNKTTRFLLIGEGPYRDRLNEEFGNSVITPGRVPYSEIDQYYKASNLYIHPSQYEGIPLVILEALSTGLPVLARNAGDISSVTPNTVDSPDEMATRIRERDYSSEWLNKHRFTTEYQSRTLQRVLSELI